VTGPIPAGSRRPVAGRSFYLPLMKVIRRWGAHFPICGCVISNFYGHDADSSLVCGGGVFRDIEGDSYGFHRNQGGYAR